MTALSYTSGDLLRERMGGGTADSSIYDEIGHQVNEFIEGYIGGPVGPIPGTAGTASRTFDGDGGRVLWIRQGVQAITTLEVASQTGGSYVTLASTEYKLRPHDYDRPTGWPGRYIVLTETATTNFTAGYDTVRVTPGTALGWGWAVIPEELQLVALVLGTRIFQSRKSGEGLAVGESETGMLLFRFLPEPEHRATLDRYRYVVSPAYTG